MRVITEADRDAAADRLVKSINFVSLTESQIRAIQKATGQNAGVKYSAVIP